MKDVKLLPGDCPDAEFLAIYLDGQLTAAENALVESHLSNCRRCRRLVAAALRSEETVALPFPTDES